MSDVTHLVVEEGTSKGMKISVPPEGARLGRSSRNDVVLDDPLLSRHHCRLFFRTNDGLCLTDLGSANKTYLNGAEIQDTRVEIGDIIALGNTKIKVVYDGITGLTDKHAAPAPALNPSVGAPALNLNAPSPDVANKKTPDQPSVVDLGLSQTSPQTKGKALGKGPLILAGSLVIVLAVAAWIPKFLETGGDNLVPDKRPTNIKKTLEIEYEKIDAKVDNIFYYNLTIERDNRIAVEVHDLASNRRIKEEGQTKKSVIDDLIDDIEDSGFFELDDEYAGLPPANTEKRWDLTITINDRSRRVVVRNRAEPPIFKDLRESIEVFAMNDLNLPDMHFSTEELINMAQDEYLQAKKLYAERDHKHENLFNAIKFYKRALTNLRSIEAKPPFFNECVANSAMCEKELDAEYKELKFEADRCRRVKEWESAADHLRVIRQMIPDRGDDRYTEADKQLIAVERHIEEEN
jgi:hypothetical protein